MTRCYKCFIEKENNELQCKSCGYLSPSGELDPYYLAEGTILHDRYLIGAVLGHGGFGITYAALDQKLNIRVAIKEYLPGDIATRMDGSSTVRSYSGDKKDQFDHGLKRFLDEAQSLARYNAHPCIVSTTDYFEANNTAYLVMEYLDGIALNEYLNRKGGKISWEETLEIMMPVMDALREVHKSGMIHRDISPDNIYITNEGQVKLLDFGAARFALGEKSKSLSVVLKPGYAPPEQYSSRGKQGPWTDVYAVAATMYKMVTGKSMVEAMDRSMDDSYKKPSEMDITINADIENALVKALEFRPESRWQNIIELQEAIKIKVNQYDLDKKDTEDPKVSVEPKLQDSECLNSEINEIPRDKKKTTKKRIISLLSILVIIITASTLLILNKYYINIDNPIVNGCIGDQLFVDKSEFEEIYHLDLSGRGIEDISVLELMPNLEQLNISNNNISDISALAKLKSLKTLVASKNNIVDLSPLASLNEIEGLVLANNSIEDLSVLANINRIHYIDLSDNELIRDITSISELPDGAWITFEGTDILGTRENINTVHKLSTRRFEEQSLYIDSEINVFFEEDSTILNGRLSEYVEKEINNYGIYSNVISEELLQLVYYYDVNEESDYDKETLKKMTNLKSIDLRYDGDYSVLSELEYLEAVRFQYITDNYDFLKNIQGLNQIEFLIDESQDISDILEVVKSIGNLEEIVVMETEEFRLEDSVELRNIANQLWTLCNEVYFSNRLSLWDYRYFRAYLYDEETGEPLFASYDSETEDELTDDELIALFEDSFNDYLSGYYEVAFERLNGLLCYISTIDNFQEYECLSGEDSLIPKIYYYLGRSLVHLMDDDLAALDSFEKDMIVSCFEVILRNYPDSILADDAAFWLGEINQ